MEIKDYLHLYLGCQIMNTESNQISTLESISVSGLLGDENRDDSGEGWFDIRDIKPLLHPLSSIESKKLNHLMSYEYWNDVPDDIKNWFGARAKMIKELLDEHVDLFGLIEAGLAIDATTLKEPLTPSEADLSLHKHLS